jgi:NAD(P)-dependent dehydrogenase (short-subunit alcohol dehydrogenase family)
MHMSRDFKPLQGRVALVTGGSRGIGAGISRKLASWGATLAINYVDRSGPARALAAELQERGTKVTLHRADLADPDAITKLMEQIGAEYGSLNILVQNAGATKFAKLVDATLEQWQFVQDTNARSTWLLAQAVLPLMQDRDGARFITITNSTTTRIIPRAGLFAAAKASLEALTDYLSFELAPHGIVVNCVRPGLVQTGVFKVRPDFAGGVKHEQRISPWPGGKQTTVENSADVVALLCLDEASWIAGQTITVDGGYRLWGGIGATAGSNGHVDASRADASRADVRPGV